MFYKKATKIDEIFTVDLTLFSKCQTDGGVFVSFRLENMNPNETDGKFGFLINHESRKTKQNKNKNKHKFLTVFVLKYRKQHKKQFQQECPLHSHDSRNQQILF